MGQVVKIAGDDLTVGFTIRDPLTGTGIPSGLTVTATIKKLSGTDLYWGGTSFDQASEPSGTTVPHIRNGRYEVSLASMAESTHVIYEVHIVITGSSVTGVNQNFVITDEVIIGVINSISESSSGALHFAPGDDNVGGALIGGITFDGVETSGTWASVSAEDGTFHNIDDTTNNIDIVYEVTVGGGRTSSELTWKGYLSSNNDEFLIKLWNGSSWDTLRTVSGQAGTSIVTEVIPLLASHTNSGVCYVRLECISQSNPSLYTDQLLVSAINVGQTVGYAGGAIWIDTVNGTAGTESFVNGTADNPVASMADALTIANSIGMVDFHVINGSAITFASSMANKSMVGDHYTVALGGQACGGLYLQGATVSGIATSSGEEMHFEGCDFTTATVEQAHWDKCGFSGTVTLNTADNYDLHGCYSKGTAVPVFTKTSEVAMNFETHDWNGDITVSGIQEDDSVEIGGNEMRTVTLNGTGGTGHIHGHYETLAGTLTGVSVTGAIKFGDLADIPMRRAIAVANFYFVLFDTNGDAVTGLGATVTVNVSKDGAGFTTVTGPVTEIGNGVYRTALTTTDTDFVEAMFTFTGAGASTTFKEVITESAV